MAMSTEEFLTFVEARKGRFFAVQFEKRTTGELRKMLCRTGVKAHLRGGPQAYDPAAKGLLCVWDVTKKAYRSIALEGLRRVFKDGLWVEITPF